MHPSTFEKQNLSTITLPVGLFIANSLERQATIRALYGADEDWLLATDKNCNALELTVNILSRCLVRIGSIHPVTQELVRQLPIIDKDMLLLELVKLTWGNRVEATVTCPQPACREKMDIDFDLEQITPGEALPDDGCIDFTIQQSTHNREILVRCRYPTISDLHTLLMSAATGDSDQLAIKLIQHCIEEVDHQPASKTAWVEEGSVSMFSQIEEKLDKASSQFNLQFELSCPECGYDFTIPFDPLEFLLQKLYGGLKSFYREVHTLAFWYHWSEADILAMDREKRHRYLGLINDELERQQL